MAPGLEQVLAVESDTVNAAYPIFRRGEAPDYMYGASARARSHCRFVLQLIHFILDSLTYSVLLFLIRQCDRTPGQPPHRALRPRRASAAMQVYTNARGPPVCLFWILY
jgi:hypothetical protein